MNIKQKLTKFIGDIRTTAHDREDIMGKALDKWAQKSALRSYERAKAKAANGKPPRKVTCVANPNIHRLLITDAEKSEATTSKD
jgi:hypothetical protein